MTSSRFNPGSTSVQPQKPRTSPFYGSMNGPGLKTLLPTRIALVFYSDDFFPIRYYLSTIFFRLVKVEVHTMYAFRS